ncbi:MAG TPA: glycosyltransferase [Phycisphaerales bacterium]|nr:glycosyltransferase [Phycisphaerales bacterium]
MRIVQITPGSGNTFYCENCLRDATLARPLRDLGHDVLMVPMYLPVEIGDQDYSPDSELFFGGINVYLQQKIPLFRRTPRWLDRLFDSRRLLRWAGRRVGMTSPRDLAETTLSILAAEHGRQAKELDRLIEWLRQRDNRPDIVCLSNVLLAGLAKEIRGRLDVPVACILQDEEGFLDSLPPPYAQQAWDLLRRRVAHVDGFIAVSEFYADVMHGRLDIDPRRLHVARPGVVTEDYASVTPAPGVPTIGFLSRMCADKGLDTLVDAFIALKQRPSLEQVQLIAAGGRQGPDARFIKSLQSRLEKAGRTPDVEFLDVFDAPAKRSLFARLTVLSVPEKQPTSYATYMLEALAAGVPFVEPDSGVFGELHRAVGGGVLCRPNDASALADALEPLLMDAGQSRALGAEGRRRVVERFDVRRTAVDLLRALEIIAQSYR